MRLTDKLEILDTEGETLQVVRAHVGHVTTTALQGLGSQVILAEQLRAIIRPTDYATAGRRYKWRGKNYTSEAAPLVRRQHGKDHHYTITLVADG